MKLVDKYILEVGKLKLLTDGDDFDAQCKYIGLDWIFFNKISNDMNM